MGSWQLEVLRMTLYIFFPVGMFHVFNQPGYIRDQIEQERKEQYENNPVLQKNVQMFLQFKEEHKNKMETLKLKQMEKEYQEKMK